MFACSQNFYMSLSQDSPQFGSIPLFSCSNETRGIVFSLYLSEDKRQNFHPGLILFSYICTFAVIFIIFCKPFANKNRSLLAKNRKTVNLSIQITLPWFFYPVPLMGSLMPNPTLFGAFRVFDDTVRREAGGVGRDVGEGNQCRNPTEIYLIKPQSGRHPSFHLEAFPSLSFIHKDF